MFNLPFISKNSNIERENDTQRYRKKPINEFKLLFLDEESFRLKTNFAR